VDAGRTRRLGERLAAQLAAHDYPGVPGAKVDGGRVKDETLADLAGLELAWQAWSAAHPQADQAEHQAFFRAWSRLWAQQVGGNVAAGRLAADIHAPGPLRSNVPLANLPAFATAWGCQPGQPMRMPEAGQVRVWR